MKKSLILLLGSVLLLAGCGSKSADTASSIAPSPSEDIPTESSDIPTSDTEEPSSEDSEPSVEKETYTTPEGFASSFSAGYQFDVTSGSQDLLKSAMDPEGRIIDSIETNCITVQGHVFESGDTVLELTVGTGSSDGALTLNTSVPLYSISFELQSYSKYVAYSSMYSRDAAPTVTVNDENAFTLSPAEEGENPVETYSVEFTEKTSKITLKNDDSKHRVFVKSVTFTF